MELFIASDPGGPVAVKAVDAASAFTAHWGVAPGDVTCATELGYDDPLAVERVVVEDEFVLVQFVRLTPTSDALVLEAIRADDPSVQRSTLTSLGIRVDDDGNVSGPFRPDTMAEMDALSASLPDGAFQGDDDEPSDDELDAFQDGRTDDALVDDHDPRPDNWTTDDDGNSIDKSSYGYTFNYQRGLEAEPRLGEDPTSRQGHWDGINERVRRLASSGQLDSTLGSYARRVVADAARERLATTPSTTG